MVQCPNCKNKIPFKKVLFLTSFNRIQCKSCGKYLVCNQLRGSLFGGIGGGVGALVLLYALKSFLSKTFGIKNIVLIILWIVSLVIVSYYFTKLELDEYNFL
ncbi:hypothetical protein [Clostridium senegalense]|uniref:hypothetical protein n=1 Tax=Clostridium senegalense TaxID=1465809 RepID=UPI00028A0767|nr:hypothetical protein [Clostridium senegalense]MBU5226522.1 hypothetical protein [Clostridium senegalense]